MELNELTTNELTSEFYDLIESKTKLLIKNYIMESHELIINELTSKFDNLIEAKIDDAFSRSDIYDFIFELDRRDSN